MSATRKNGPKCMGIDPLTGLPPIPPKRDEALLMCLRLLEEMADRLRLILAAARKQAKDEMEPPCPRHGHVNCDC